MIGHSKRCALRKLIIAFCFVVTIVYTLSVISTLHWTPSSSSLVTSTPSSSSSLSRQIEGELSLVNLTSPSSVHGWVKKSGPAAVETWHMSQDLPRRARWDEYLESRALGKIPMDHSYDAVPPHGPDPWGCRLYFNREYKLFFVRTAKTGSTTILESILPACVKAPDVPHCLERVADTEMSVEEVSKLWIEYTAFTFTRNVWRRAISQYEYLVHFLRSNSSSNERMPCPRATWNDFCRDPLILGAICRKEPRCCSKKWTHQDWHMRQQTSCFLTDQYSGSHSPEWAVDFIGRLEHFDDDVRELFDVVNSKR